MRFRVAKSTIKLDNFSRAVLNHQARVQAAAINNSFRLERGNRRLENFFFDLRGNFLVDNRSRRISTHAARIQALVAVENSLVVLRGNQRDNFFAVRQRKHRSLLAVHEFFHDDFIARHAESFHLVDRVQSLVQILRNDNALARRQSVSFYNNRRIFFADIIFGGVSVVENFKIGGRNVVFLHEPLSKNFRAFNLRGKFIRTERLNARRVERIRQAVHQRGFGADNNQINRVFFSEVHKRGVVGD